MAILIKFFYGQFNKSNITNIKLLLKNSNFKYKY